MEQQIREEMKIEFEKQREREKKEAERLIA